MERFAYQELLTWKNSPTRKPLIIDGARQVGKTWLMQNFAKNEYKNCLYVNFELSKQLRNIFDDDFDVQRIISRLEFATKQKVSANDTLIILDEIQEAHEGITSLKYFCELAPELHVVCAGSLLGIELHKHTSFPVGKVDFLHLYPLSFPEFLMATGNKQMLDLLHSRDWNFIAEYKERFIEQLKHYFYVGGMPEAVLEYSQTKDIEKVRTIQNNILEAYQRDFSKHAPEEIVPRLKLLWNSIPQQVTKENRKFVYGVVKDGARAKDYELALLWLENSGIIYRCQRTSTPALPLSAYCDIKSFKIFVVDIGLLGAICDLPESILLDKSRIFSEFKGAITEQYVYQQLKADSKNKIYYWSSDEGKAELDFLLQRTGTIIPLEVKANVNLKAKSLWSFNHQFHPERAIRTSLSNYAQSAWLDDIPLYAVSEFF